ncbi:cellulose synthase/poly-beta-1,6-N-acetylglucosamine synthase-like glycosyltransferase [Silvibacterium bohemicum]|uniref:Cellulose synthase/poly-beta-1,6-N-acetylglucosamine synthase-like glycosyltransferase n=1 Tax=Silvibacterium bohemicum TaxID=1577686 RepID=A0A841JN49_9BACT|nr:glycosyltransferase family 2 protein [Silvibacterium bohemicum]MBB6142802.1 cellulose synthase/poly-beta-1,6-N-acetylglucosamine synthase-like glycosyltransferase [Silvibacterium bohemicum]
MNNAIYISLAVVLVLATLPLVLELLIVTSALFLPRRKPRGLQTQHIGRLTVIVPAHNEELLIARCVTSLRASANDTARILVIAHNCSDNTAIAAQTAGAEVLVFADPSASGKGHALRMGFAAAMNEGADAVVIVDADSTVSANFIPMVREALGEGSDVVQCRYEMKSVTDKGNSGLASLAFRGFTFIRPLGRDRLGLSAGILGNGFAISARTLREVPYEAFSVVEDLEYHLHLLLAKRRVRFIEDAVVSAELPVSRSGEVSQRSRWEGGRIRVAKMWALPLLKQILRGRFSLIEPLLDLAGLPLAFGVSALIAVSLIPLPAVRIYGLLSLAIVFAHVLLAAWAGPHFFRTLRLLALSPFYILWKFRLVPKLLRASQAEAAWIRTSR